MAFIESRKKQEGGGGTERFNVVLSVPSSQGTDIAQTAYTYISDINGKFFAVITGITDCGNNEAYISLEVNGVEKSRGTLITDKSTVVSFSNIPVSIGDIVDIKFGWVRLHGCKYDGTAEIVIIGDGGDEVFNPVFSERTIATNNNQSSFTFTEDYHNFDFVKVTTHNISSGIDTDFITTPSIIDACISLGAVNFNEYDNNQYVTYSESGLTWTQYRSARNLYVSEVKGMTCENATVSETVVYQAQARSGTSVTVTYSQGSLFDFDLILFGANSSADDEIQPCYYSFSSGIRLMDKVGTAFNVYNAYDAISISEHELSANRYACVVGIKFIHQINPGKITLPQFSETTIATGDSSGVTFTEDWHNYQFINIKSVNTSSNAVTYQLATPAAIDSIFDVNKYLVANEAGTNIYGSYANSSSTFWELKGSRSMRITEVTGLNCINGTVTETEIYNKGSYDTSQRALTGLTDLFSYDMFILCLSKDDIQPNCYCASKGLIFSNQPSFKTIVTPYDDQYAITITDTEMSSTYYHYVSGIKFT